jgi:hypothetical protein
VAERPASIERLIDRMEALVGALRAKDDPARYLLAANRRTTLAARDLLAGGGFADAEWVERWASP